MLTGLEGIERVAIRERCRTTWRGHSARPRNSSRGSSPLRASRRISMQQPKRPRYVVKGSVLLVPLVATEAWLSGRYAALSVAGPHLLWTAAYVVIGAADAPRGRSSAVIVAHHLFQKNSLRCE